METKVAAIKIARRSKAQRQELIEQWRQSGKKKKAFCEEKRLNYLTFISWTCPKKKRREKKVSGFAPVIMSKNMAVLFAGIAYSNGSAIELHQWVPAQYLRRLVK